jgi:hypothetical protein
LLPHLSIVGSQMAHRPQLARNTEERDGNKHGKRKGKKN